VLTRERRKKGSATGDEGSPSDLESSAPVRLSDDYYLINFRELLDFVARVYDDVLSEEELNWCHRFRKLPEDAQRLYIRLLCRTPSCFRRSRLAYPEISDISLAAVNLSDAGFLVVDDALTLADALPLFTRQELLAHLDLTIPRQSRRAEIDRHIIEELDESLTLAKLLTKDQIYRVLQQSVFDVYRLCFFGNLYQDMTEFVLRDLGLTRFESYPVNVLTRVFKNRQQLENQQQYFACADQYDDAVDTGVEAILLLHSELPDYRNIIDEPDNNLDRRCERLVNRLARHLERMEEYDHALSLYRSVRRPPSRERQARVLYKIEQPEAALTLCREIVAAPVNEEELEFADQFGAKVAKVLQEDWDRPRRFSPTKSSLELVQSELSVERSVAVHLETRGHCFYTENVLFNGVFGLSFWSVIFAPVANVYFNPFQSAPADFNHPEFAVTRKKLINDRFDELSTIKDLHELVWRVWNEKRGIQNPMVNWRFLTKDLLTEALDRIPLAHWLMIFKRLLSDLRNHRNGFPDLVLFPEEGGYELIEVKGPGDTLQKNQLRWMKFFRKHEIPCSVTHVTWRPHH